MFKICCDTQIVTHKAYVRWQNCVNFDEQVATVTSNDTSTMFITVITSTNLALFPVDIFQKHCRLESRRTLFKAIVRAIIKAIVLNQVVFQQCSQISTRILLKTKKKKRFSNSRQITPDHERSLGDKTEVICYFADSTSAQRKVPLATSFWEINAPTKIARPCLNELV